MPSYKLVQIFHLLHWRSISKSMITYYMALLMHDTALTKKPLMGPMAVFYPYSNLSFKETQKQSNS